MISRDIPYKATKTSHGSAYLGVRQCGKSYLAMAHANFDNHNALYYNFEDPIVTEAKGPEFIDLLLEVYSENYRSTPNTLILDEIQNIPGWEKWVRKHVEIKDYQIFITGSSSKLLSRELASSVSGRVLETNVWPLSYKEYLRFSNAHPKTPNEHLGFIKHFLEWGGFPDVVLQNDEMVRAHLLRQYLSDIVYKDVMSRHEIRNKHQLDLIVLNAFKNCSTLQSYNSIKKGFGIPVETIQSYMKYLNEAFVVFEVLRYHENLKVQSRDPRKVYVIDSGLRNCVTHSANEELGKLAENSVYLELRRRGYEKIFYWSMEKEVDFVAVQGFKAVQAIQVCWEMEDVKTHHREIEGLLEAAP